MADGGRPAAALPPIDGGGIVAIADRLAALGIAELPLGSNRGPAVDVFTGGRAEPWCADFVSWVLRAAGHPLVGGEEGWRLPWTGDVRSWFAARGRYRDRAVAMPLPGDVVYFLHGHVGIVVAVRGSAIETVEGNNGDAVRRVVRDGWRADPDIGGFGRVPEPDEGPASQAGGMPAAPRSSTRVDGRRVRHTRPGRAIRETARSAP
jgi:hypothetical protein